MTSMVANLALGSAICFVAFNTASSSLSSGMMAVRTAPATMPVAPMRAFHQPQMRMNSLRTNAEASLGLTGYVPYPDTTGASLTPLPPSGEKSKFSDELKATAAAIVADGKGILACDESTKTIGKRLEQIGVPNEEAMRRAWRELLFRTPNMNEAISSAILYEETLFQNAEDGTPFVDIMKSLNVIPGIKVDTGVRATFMDGETITDGLDGLAERAQKYYAQGARFAKWRGVLRIDPNGAPSMEAIEANAPPSPTTVRSAR